MYDALSIYWHGILMGLAGRLRHSDSAVHLDQCRNGVLLHFHVLGGGIHEKLQTPLDTASQSNAHAGMDLMAWRDADNVHLPLSMNRYPQAATNREMYYWLGAFLAADQSINDEDQLSTGVAHLLHGVLISAKVLRRFPGLKPRYQRLCEAELTQRNDLLPNLGGSKGRVHQLECGVRFALGNHDIPLESWLKKAIVRAQDGVLLDNPPAIWCKRYTPILPVPLWRRPKDDNRGLTLRLLKGARRRQPRQIDSATANRRFDKQDVEKRIHSTPTPDAVIQARYSYPEWDNDIARLIPDRCVVTEKIPTTISSDVDLVDNEIRSLSRLVRRQFESCSHARRWQRSLDYGDELNIDACVEAFGDRRGYGLNSSAVYQSKIKNARDLSVAVLIDSSRSTNALVGDRRVIEIAQRSMLVLAEGLDAVGDSFALYGFSSDSHLRVNIDLIKNFDDTYDSRVRGRLGAVTASNYTRMGAALRHVGARLMQRTTRQKLLLVLTDGQPTDPTDQYTGDYALEDTRHALMELRRRGIHGFGLTIDRHDHDYLPRIFGPAHYAVFSEVESLPRLLPRLYARITGLEA